MATIFISHSAHEDEDPVSFKYLETMRRTLEEAGHEILLDRIRLKSGDDWNAVIVNWMYVCDVAVILFSPRALTSSYVLFEVSNLVGRLRRETGARLEPGRGAVKICPVVGPGITVEQIREGFFGAIDFHLLHVLGPCDDDRELASKLLDAIPDTSLNATWLDDLVDGITDILSRHRDALPAALREGGVSLKDTSPAEHPRRLARHLMTCSLTDVLRILRKIPGLREDAAVILDLVAPSWVSPEAAQTLRTMLPNNRTTPAYRCAVINGEHADFTPEMYLRRARAVVQTDAGTVVQINPPDHVLDDRTALMQEIREALAAEFDLDSDRVDIDTAIAAEIGKEVRIRARPVLVVVSRGAIPVREYFTLLEAIQHETFLQQVTLVAMAGVDVARCDPDWKVVLEPLLPERQEASHRETYQAIFSTRPKPPAQSR